MANVDAPSGLIADRHLLGSEVRTNNYAIASGLAENIGLNAAVKSTGTGKRVSLAAAGDTLRGVFAGCQYQDVSGNVVFSKNWVSGTVTLNSADATALVYDDPWILFQTQASGAFTAADIGLNADLTTGAASNGVSTAEVDSTTFTTAAAQVKVYDYVRDDSNEVTTNAKLLVLLNEHEIKAQTAGV